VNELTTEETFRELDVIPFMGISDVNRPSGRDAIAEIACHDIGIRGALVPDYISGSEAFHLNLFHRHFPLLSIPIEASNQRG
jgi:hypothetical protein